MESSHVTVVTTQQASFAISTVVPASITHTAPPHPDLACSRPLPNDLKSMS